MSQADATSTELTDAERAELERLRVHVAELEQRLLSQAAKTNEIVARAQERVYWLDRWHLDLNSLMERPGAAELRGLLRAARWLARLPKRARRKLQRQ